MPAVTLTRRDPARNQHRYYRLVQPNLFGQWCFIREWGRIGQHVGQSRTVPFLTPTEAALARQRRAKERRSCT